MNSSRHTSTTAGVLFVVATGSQLVAGALDPTGSGGPIDHSSRLAIASVLYLVAAGTSAGIAVALYPVLSSSGQALALGSVVFRTMEAVCYTVGVVCLLSVVPAGAQTAAPVAPGRPSWQTVASTMVGLRDHAVLAGVVFFSVGALAYYLVLYRSLLVPRWLSGWGVIGTLLMLTACLLALFADRPVTGYTALIVPIAIQELVLAGRLLVKGFDSRPQRVLVPTGA
jgi:hypothetical protein